MRVIWEAFGPIHLIDEEEHRGQLINQQRRLSTQEVTAVFRQIVIHFRKRSSPSLPTWNTYRRIKSGRVPRTGWLEQRPVIQADIYIKDGFRAFASVVTQCHCLRQPGRNDDVVHRAMRRSWIRIPSRPPDSQKTERRWFFEEWSAVLSSKQFFHRAHREKEPPLNPWKFEKPILLVERQSVRVFGINDDASGSHFPAVQHGSVERIH